MDASRLSRLEAVAGGLHIDRAVIEHRLRVPNSQRLFYLKAALEAGWPLSELYDLTGIDPWFLENLRQITEFEKELAGLVA